MPVTSEKVPEKPPRPPVQQSVKLSPAHMLPPGSEELKIEDESSYAGESSLKSNKIFKIKLIPVKLIGGSGGGSDQSQY